VFRDKPFYNPDPKKREYATLTSITGQVIKIYSDWLAEARITKSRNKTTISKGTLVLTVKETPEQIAYLRQCLFINKRPDPTILKGLEDPDYDYILGDELL